MRKVLVGVIAGALLSMIAGPIAGTPALAAASTRPCGRSGTVALDDRANGRHLHLCKGARLTVVLHAPPAGSPDTWWPPLTVTGAAVQIDPYHPRIMPARGATVGFFRAVHRGTATLSSARHVCPVNPSGPTCHAVAYWQIVVEVR